MIMNFMREQKGFISILLCIVLLPMVTYATMIVDAARLQSSRTQLQVAGDLAMNAGLSEFEKKLEEMYGLFANCENEADLEPVIEQYFRETIEASLESSDDQKAYTQRLARELTDLVFENGDVNEEELMNFVEMQLNDADFDFYMIPESRVSNPMIMKGQIIDYMKYKGPLSISTNLLHKLNFLQDSTNQIDAVDKKIEFTKEVAKLDDIYGDAWEKLKAYNEVRQNYKYDKPGMDGKSYFEFNYDNQDTKDYLSEALENHQRNYFGLMRTAKYHNAYLALRNSVNDTKPSLETIAKNRGYIDPYWSPTPAVNDLNGLNDELTIIISKVNTSIFDVNAISTYDDACINSVFDQKHYSISGYEYFPSASNISELQGKLDACKTGISPTSWDIKKMYDIQVEALQNAEQLYDKEAAKWALQQLYTSYHNILIQQKDGVSYYDRLTSIVKWDHEQKNQNDEKTNSSKSDADNTDTTNSENEENKLTDEQKQAIEDQKIIDASLAETLLGFESDVKKILDNWECADYKAYLKNIFTENQDYNKIGKAYQSLLNDVLVDYRDKSKDMETKAYELAQSLSKVQAQMGAAQKKGEQWKTQVGKVKDGTTKSEMEADVASEMQNINADDVLALFKIPDDIGGRIGLETNTNGRLVDLNHDDFMSIKCMDESVLDKRYYDSMRDNSKLAVTDTAVHTSTELEESLKPLFETYTNGSFYNDSTGQLSEHIDIVRLLDGLDDNDLSKVADDEKFYYVLKNEAEAKTKTKPSMGAENQNTANQMKAGIKDQQDAIPEDTSESTTENTTQESSKNDEKKDAGKFSEVNDAFTALRTADKENGSTSDDSNDYGSMDKGTGNVGSSSSDFQSGTDSGLNSLRAAKGLLESMMNIGQNLRDDMYLEEYFTENFTCQTDKAEKNTGRVKLLNGYMNGTPKKTASNDKNASSKADETAVPEKLINVDNEWYGAEIEYILWGDSNMKMNLAKTEGMIFLIRFALNAIYAFQAGDITSFAEAVAVATVGWSGVLIPMYMVGCILIITVAYFAAAFQSAYIKGEKLNLRSVFFQNFSFFFAFLLLGCAVTVLEFLFSESKGKNWLQSMESIILWEGLVFAGWTDFRIKKIPNELIMVMMGLRCVGVMLHILIRHEYWKTVILSAMAGFLMAWISLLICRFITRGGIGAGDIKLFGVIGFYIGIIGYVNVLFYSILFAALLSIVLLISKKAEKKAKIPLGPFVLFAYSVYLLLE